MYCTVCDGKSFNRLYDQLLKCTHCGFVWADVGSGKDEIIRIYEENEYFFGGEYENYIKEKNILQKNFKLNLDKILKFSNSGNLFEIGCAYGFFLDIARYKFKVTGIDVNHDACNYARSQLGLDAICGDFLRTDIKKEYYDVVACWATLEHLGSPHHYIEKAASILKKGGIFACSTCDIDSLVARIRKEKWRLIHPPTHLSYFSSSTLRMLLEKYNFQVIDSFKLGQYRSIENVIYSMLVLKHGFNRFYNFLKRLRLTRGYFYLNTYDSIYMIARKN